MGVEPRLCNRGRRTARAILNIARARIMLSTTNSGEGKKRLTQTGVWGPSPQSLDLLALNISQSDSFQ